VSAESIRKALRKMGAERPAVPVVAKEVPVAGPLAPLNGQQFDRAKALELRMKHNMSYGQIGTQLGVSGESVRKALKKVGADHAPLRQAFQENKAEVLELLQLRIVKSIDDEQIKKMAPRDKFVAIGILHDKIRLERNQSTSNHALGILTQAIREATKFG